MRLDHCERAVGPVPLQAPLDGGEGPCETPQGYSPVRTILILAANPKGTERLGSTRRSKKIEQGLERAEAA